jgi:UDP-N-acetylglucosamine--N-acetylmuramyl-(pentapeptide) pyrophosphoryl-undecaprenol N-acetylglucosamine transferase
MNVVIAGGGTGGHLFPGIALAEELRARGHHVTFVGTERGIEARVLPKEGWPLELIEVRGLKGGGFGGFLRGSWQVPNALLRSGKILGKLSPGLVVGVGGYASGPVVLRAALSRIPTAILEQNSIPGITNRALGKVVRMVCGSFPGAARYFPTRKYHLLGNPVRTKVRSAMAAAEEGPDSSRAATGLLVVGSSQGAHAVNELVVEALTLLRARGVRMPVVHQTGTADRDTVAARYAAAGIAADVRAFIDDMAGAYRAARLVVARAGASTIAELTALGMPSLLVPFPQAADDHQTANARDLEEAGAARLLVQATTTPAQLADTIAALFDDAAALARMRAAARSLGHPDAHREIADALLALAEAT